MSFARINPNVEGTSLPGIAEMNALAGDLRERGERLCNFGQAIPFFRPPPAALAALAAGLEDPALHRYTPDPGLLSLRESWSRMQRERFGLVCDPAREMLITAGANGAYLTAVMTLLRPGDRMALLTPFYFNHAMAVTLMGSESVEIPLAPDSGYDLDPDRILGEVRRTDCRALTLVNPCNPTGTTFAPEALRRLVDGLREDGRFLIVDETYAFYPGPDRPYFSPGSLETGPQGIITLGSFSKTFALTGWRVGYLIAGAALLAQMLKVQDTMVICAPHPGQRLVAACLEHAWEEWLPRHQQELEIRRRRFLTESGKLHPWRVRSCGPFFAFLEGPADGRSTALRLLREHRTVVIPGDIFGRGLANTLRVSIGGIPPDEWEDGLQRLQEGLQRTLTPTLSRSREREG